MATDYSDPRAIYVNCTLKRSPEVSHTQGLADRLQHLGYTIPPQADSGWLGEAGPGPSYLDDRLGRAGQRLHQSQHRVHDVEPAAHPNPEHR